MNNYCFIAVLFLMNVQNLLCQKVEVVFPQPYRGQSFSDFRDEGNYLVLSNRYRLPGGVDTTFIQGVLTGENTINFAEYVTGPNVREIALKADWSNQRIFLGSQDLFGGLETPYFKSFSFTDEGWEQKDLSDLLPANYVFGYTAFTDSSPNGEFAVTLEYYFSPIINPPSVILVFQTTDDGLSKIAEFYVNIYRDGKGLSLAHTDDLSTIVASTYIFTLQDSEMDGYIVTYESTSNDGYQAVDTLFSTYDDAVFGTNIEVDEDRMYVASSEIRGDRINEDEWVYYLDLYEREGSGWKKLKNLYTYKGGVQQYSLTSTKFKYFDIENDVITYLTFDNEQCIVNAARLLPSGLIDDSTIKVVSIFSPPRFGGMMSLELSDDGSEVLVTNYLYGIAQGKAGVYSTNLFVETKDLPKTKEQQRGLFFQNSIRLPKDLVPADLTLHNSIGQMLVHERETLELNSLGSLPSGIYYLTYSLKDNPPEVFIAVKR